MEIQELNELRNIYHRQLLNRQEIMSYTIKIAIGVKNGITVEKEKLFENLVNAIANNNIEHTIVCFDNSFDDLVKILIPSKNEISVDTNGINADELIKKYVGGVN